ncbi:MAG: DUF447 family protein [Gammaproteobacteria bacterium]|nr:DUF447 family protein [Gammaproteobacteria bacterium]
MIHETIVTTLNADGGVHVAPMGIREAEGRYVIAPFRPSTTLENLQRAGCAVINLTDDVMIFAGCLTGRYDWPTRPASRIAGRLLESALAHIEVEVERCVEEELRPQYFCRVVHHASHRPFAGFNRAQAAVLEAAILVSRLDRLSADKIDGELDYLRIAVEKTAGERERIAWAWLLERIEQHRGARHAEAVGS